MNWKLEEKSVTFDYGKTPIKIEIESEFDLRKISRELLDLAAWALLYPYGKEPTGQRKPSGKNIGLAFSGGVDSTAVLTLYDDYRDIILFYNQRSDDFPIGKFNQKTGIEIINNFKKVSRKNVFFVKSNMEKIRDDLKGSGVGFLSDAHYFLGHILMADFVGIKYLSCGAMFDGRRQPNKENKNKGSSIGDISFFKKWKIVFEKHGFNLFFPVSGCSEIITSEIVREGKYSGMAVSCVRGESIKNPCGVCPKCFRKNLIEGIKPTITKSLEQYIPKSKQLQAIAYSAKKFNIEIKGIEKYKDSDLSYIEKYHKGDLSSVPVELLEDYKNRIKKYL